MLQICDMECLLERFVQEFVSFHCSIGNKEKLDFFCSLLWLSLVLLLGCCLFLRVLVLDVKISFHFKGNFDNV